MSSLKGDWHKLCNIILEFTLVSERHECDGAEENGCLQTSVEDCALSCQNRSSMFIYGQHPDRCSGSKCMCWCETSADKGGNCNEKAHAGFNLFKYEEEAIKIASNITSKTCYGLLSFFPVEISIWWCESIIVLAQKSAITPILTINISEKRHTL